MSETAAELVADNFDALAETLDGMAEVVADMDDETCGILRVQLDDLLNKVKGAIGVVDLRLVALLDVGQSLNIPGGGIVTVKMGGGKQTTHGAKLARRLAARVADVKANEDGEPFPPAVLCEKTADELVDVFSLGVPSAKFKSTALKARGMRASEFLDYADGRPTVEYIR